MLRSVREEAAPAEQVAQAAQVQGREEEEGNEMKLAEALAERADLDKKLAQLKTRAIGAARYAEGEEPPERALAMLNDARTLLARKLELVRRINLTNAHAVMHLSDGHTVLTLTEALALRDFLNAERKLLTEITDEASPSSRERFYGRRRTELPEKTDLPVTHLRAEADNLSKRFRELDTQIQQLNWNTELS